MEDASVFFDDGDLVTATIGIVNYETRGFLDRPTEEAFGGAVAVTHWELRYATSVLPGMAKNQLLTINGQQYKTTEPPRMISDGATSIVSLTRI